MTGDTLAACGRGDNPQVMQRLQQEMTPEEKAKLYAALNYSEGMARGIYPPEYVSTAVEFSLGGLAIMLANNDLKCVFIHMPLFVPHEILSFVNGT